MPAAQVADRDDLDDDDDDDDGIDDDDDEGWDDEPLRAAPPASGPAREQLMGSPMLLSTYKNAGPLLRGLSSEQTGILSPALAIRFQLPGRQNEHDLRFSFDHAADLPKRIAVVIGKNGVGKSQTLGRIARAALDGTAALTDGTDGGRPLINRLLAFAPTNEAESVFPTDKRKRPRIWYQRYSMNRSRRSRRNDYLSDLIVQVARSTQMVASNSRWEIFTEALSAITKADELHLPTRSTSSAYVPLAKLPQGAEQRVLERFASIDVKKEPTRVVAGEGYGPKFPPQWPYRTGAGAARSRERCISGVGTTTGRCDGAALS